MVQSSYKCMPIHRWSTETLNDAILLQLHVISSLRTFPPHRPREYGSRDGGFRERQGGPSSFRRNDSGGSARGWSDEAPRTGGYSGGGGAPRGGGGGGGRFVVLYLVLCARLCALGRRKGAL